MRILMAAAVAIAALGTSGAAHAQTTPLEGRVDRLEHEMRAVQRKVFPGGAGQTVEPEITQPAVTDVAGTPATSPVTDLTQRVAALESQVATLTGQVEQLGYRQRQFEDAYSASKRTLEARIKALEDTASAVGAGHAGDAAIVPDTIPAPAAAVIDTPPKPIAKPVAKPPAVKPETPATAAPAAATTPPAAGSRAAQVAKVVRPSTADPADDGYFYGYRLWQAKLYPEARAALEEVVAKYPKHRRASYAQNLLGRAYLDAGAPSLAAVAFYENYKKNPNGERAPDSLYYLAQALMQLKKPASEVCKVYAELSQLYGDKLSPEMTTGVAEGRVKNKCQ